MAEQEGVRDQVPGGLADNRPDSDFDPEQLAKGIRVELEHTDDPVLAKEIAKDHLVEDARYYDRLQKMEAEAKAEQEDDNVHPESYSRVDDVIEFLETVAPDSILENVEVISRDEWGWDAIHVSRNTEIPVFTPRISARMAEKEDDTVPRIPVANSLIGCLLSRQSDEHEFYAERDSENRGGWAIYSLPFTHIVKPNNNVVGDAEQTGEHWIVGFDEEHREIKPIKVGEMFQQSYSYLADAKRPADDPTVLVAVLYLHVYDGCRMFITPDRHVGPGYYRLILKDWGSHHEKDLREGVDHILDRVSADHYEKDKKISAGLLSYQERIPSLKW